MTPTSRRQITTCTDPATHLLRRHHAGGLSYELTLCHRHRWVAEGWGKTLRPLDDQQRRRCGAVNDYRDPHEIVVSHFDWLTTGTAPTAAPPADRGEWAIRLRAAHQAAADLNTAASVVVALDLAATVAEETGPAAQVLLALAEAETHAAAVRRWP